MDVSGVYQFPRGSQESQVYTHITVHRCPGEHYEVNWYYMDGRISRNRTSEHHTGLTAATVERWANDPTIWLPSALTYPEGI